MIFMRMQVFLLRVFMALACVLEGVDMAFALGSGTSAMGNFVLKNGQQLDSLQFEMPLPVDKQVKVKIDGKKQKIETDSIDYITVWNKKLPDIQYIFKPFTKEYINLDSGEIEGNSDYKIWLTCDQMNDNASYWLSVGRPSFKQGKLQLNYNAAYSYTSKAYVVKKGAETASHIPDKTKDVRRWVKVFFRDDPEVVRKLEANEYDGSDWGHKYIDVRQIIKDYNPQK